MAIENTNAPAVEESPGMLPGLVDLLRLGPHLLVAEPRKGVPNELLFFRQVKIHGLSS